MAHVGVAITKRVAFRDATQEFNNTYHYQWPGLDPGANLAELCIDRLVELEKGFHSTLVTFVYARIWNAGGTQAENDMIFEKALSGTGAGGADSGMDKERAFLVYWRAGVDSLGRPVYLRKWYHSCGPIGGVGITSPILSNANGFTRAQRDSMKAVFNPLHPLSFNAGSTIGQLVGPRGRNVTGDHDVHRYLEHHQLGDQWRGN